MKSVLTTIIFSWLGLSSFSQTYDTLPQNPDTKKISISKIVELPNVKKEEIYNRMENWALKNITGRTPKNGDYYLVIFLMLNVDSNAIGIKALYDAQLSLLKDKLTVFSSNWKSGFEHGFLNVLIKDGRYKIEFSDFYHEVYFASNSNKDYDGKKWDYNDDVKPKLIGSKAKWKELRLEGINKFQKLMNDIISDLAKETQAMNF